jgi:hypothetical protein
MLDRNVPFLSVHESGPPAVAQNFVRGAGLQSCDFSFLLGPAVDLAVVVGLEAVSGGRGDPAWA